VHDGHYLKCVSVLEMFAIAPTKSPLTQNSHFISHKLQHPNVLQAPLLQIEVHITSLIIKTLPTELMEL
jgi:hypothetical protein